MECVDESTHASIPTVAFRFVFDFREGSLCAETLLAAPTNCLIAAKHVHGCLIVMIKMMQD
jgi:hypothetical protein